MSGMRTRYPKNFVLEERLERFARFIEPKPQAYRARWIEACTPTGAAPYKRLLVDMGCGKGQFATTLATQNPDALIIGLDAEPLCIAYAAQKAHENSLSNLLFVPARGDQLPSIFGVGEISTLYINYPTPFPRKRDAAGRLLHFERLCEYKELLAQDGQLLIRTDSLPLFLYAQDMLELAGYSFEVGSKFIEAHEAQSEYEERLSAQGAKRLSIAATSTHRAAAHVPEEQSLYDYLPDDLSSLDYVPYGMGAAVTNFKNYQSRHGSSWQGARSVN